MSALILVRTGVDMNKRWLETLRANLKETRERQDVDAARTAEMWDKCRNPWMSIYLGNGGYRKRKLSGTE